MLACAEMTKADKATLLLAELRKVIEEYLHIATHEILVSLFERFNRNTYRSIQGWAQYFQHTNVVLVVKTVRYHHCLLLLPALEDALQTVQAKAALELLL